MKSGAIRLPDGGLGTTARKLKADVNWHRDGGNPVGLFRLFANQPGATTQLLTLKIKDDKVSLGGKNLSRGSGDGK